MLPVVELVRLQTGVQGTFGVLLLQKEIFAITLEPPDRLNRRNVSHIPPGQYICRRDLFPKFGETFMVTNVPDREFILFHAGNVVGETQGCILIGSTYGKLKGDRAVLNSGRTFRKFMGALEGAEAFHLTIRECY